MNRTLPQKLAIPAALRRCFVGAAALAPGFALANPTGGQVVAGQVAISNPAANGTLVTQSSQSAIVNWQQFNVAGNEYVQFAQPSSSAVILNRVIGGAPSEIFGSIRANGRVFLVNTQGVLFAPGAQVDVGALVASTLDIKNEDFLAGRYVFSGGTAGGGVTNEGTIHAADGGFVVLQGDYAHNTGIVQAKLGQVVLAGGSATTLTLGSNGLVSFAVDEAAVSAQAGASNTGDIIADGGRVLMTAKVARGLVSTAVNNTGRISAQGIVDHNGEIELTADGGDVVDSGTLDVSNTTGSGGKIEITGNGNIDLQSGAQILASGSTQGGSVRVVADGDLQVRSGSSITATGSSIGGNVELSGHGSMKLRGAVNLGRGGTLTLDPTNLIIADGTGSGSSATVYEQTIEGQLQNGTNVNLVATNSITLNALTDGALDGRDLQIPGGGGNLLMGIGTVNLASGIFTEGTGGTITFVNKANTIYLDGTLTVRGGTTGGSIDIGNVTAKGIDVSVANGPGTTGGTLTVGNLTLGSGTFSVLEGDVAGQTTTIGNISYLGGPLSFNAQNLNLVTGSIDADGVGIHMVNGSVTTGDLIANKGTVSVISDKSSVTLGNVSTDDFVADASVTVSAATGITVGNISTFASASGQGTIANGSVTLSTKGGPINVNGVISTDAATFNGNGVPAGSKATVSITDDGGDITTSSIFTRASGSGAVAGDVVIKATGNVTTSSILTKAFGTGTLTNDVVINATGDVNTGDLNATSASITVSGHNISLGSLAGITVSSGASIRGSDSVKTQGQVIGPSGELTHLTLDASGTLSYANSSKIGLTAGTISLRNGSGNLDAGGLNATTGGLSIDVAGNVTAGSGSAINANALSIKSGGTIDITKATVTVGSGAASFGADPALLNAIRSDPHGQGIQLPTSPSPNAAFKAQSVQIGTITVGGGYLYVQADNYSIGQVSSSTPNTLLNVLPYSAQSNWTIPGVQLVATGLLASGTVAGQTSATAATTTAAGQPTLVIPPGIATVAFGGSAFTGNIVVPPGTVISPDTTNLVFATQGTIANANALSTTGSIVLLGHVITGLDEVPLLPQNYKPGFDHGIGWLPAPGDIYYAGVNDSNEGLIEPQSDAEAALVCGGVQ